MAGQFRVKYYRTGGHNAQFQGDGCLVLLLRWLVLSISVVIVASIFSSIEVVNFASAFLAAAVIGILNIFLRPLLFLLTLPVNIMTFGLFTFLINALMLKIASGLISGFSVQGFWSTVFGAAAISIVNSLLNLLFMNSGRTVFFRSRSGAGGFKENEIELKKRGDRWE